MTEVGPSPQIDSYKYIIMHSISEIDDDYLTIVIREAGELSEEETQLRCPDPHFEGSRLITSDENSRTFTLVWASYVSYVVHNESYATHTAADRKKSGRHLRIFEASAFLDYIEKSTFASADYPGPLTHVEVACLNHIIDVVSTELPVITTSGGKPLLRKVPDESAF